MSKLDHRGSSINSSSVVSGSLKTEIKHNNNSNNKLFKKKLIETEQL